MFAIPFLVIIAYWLWFKGLVMLAALVIAMLILRRLFPDDRR